MATQCPKCNVENPDTSSYCADCGTQLGLPKDIPVHTKTLETPFPQFSPGTSLADRYQIIKELGKGGMGEVYLAEDTNLKRQVAIKVLPQAFALDKERLARFEREARVLASLNHANIATIHGLEKSDGQQLLVMEFVEGETLAGRIKKGPLSVEEALEVCRQIAEGLESAHEKGIIHRDLKPGNIKITPEGKIKILDFGLAKAFTEDPEMIDLSKSPTLTDRMTQPGVILGTAAYMSPEQARSRPVDKRTDIWAFGCVLYECLTGKMAFPGETFSDTLAHILKGEPDWTKLPTNTPKMVKSLLRRCLQKEPRNRLRDIGDARIEMEEADLSSDMDIIGSRSFPLSWVLATGIIGILLGILFGFVAKISPGRSLSSATVASVLKIKSGHSLDGMRRPGEFNWPSRKAVAISSDGSFVVYCAVNDNADSDGVPMLYLRRLNEMKATPIPGTEGGIAPFLSPDDRLVGFYSDGKLKKISVEGGVPQDLCESGGLWGATWLLDGNIIFADSRTKGLTSIPAQGGNLEVITEPDQDQLEMRHMLPSLLPNNRGILFTISLIGKKIEPRIAVLDVKTKKWLNLLDDASDACYIPTGHIVYLKRGTLMAVPFDLKTLQVNGTPTPVISGVLHMMNSPASMINSYMGQYQISESGSMVYVPGGIIPDKKNMLVWVDHQGNEIPISSKIKPYFKPRLSPDGDMIAYQTYGEVRSVWIHDIERDVATQLTVVGDNGGTPIWSPDGNEITFAARDENQELRIFSQPAYGSSPKKRIMTASKDTPWTPSAYSPDGASLVYLAVRNGTQISIFDFREEKDLHFTVDDRGVSYPTLSLDGKWLAYCKIEAGLMEVYIRSSKGTGETLKVSHEGGRAPVWARSGKKLFYRSDDMAKMWVVDIQNEGSLAASRPKLLFEKRGFGSADPQRGYDISLDDQLFLMVKTEDRKPQPVTEMILIQNWFEELKRLVLTGK